MDDSDEERNLAASQYELKADILAKLAQEEGGPSPKEGPLPSEFDSVRRVRTRVHECSGKRDKGR